jgi:transcriptional regulator GlxA family with amidase domain
MAEALEKVKSPVTKAIELMRTDLAKRWTVTALARAVGVSRPVLARRFVEEAGMSPLRYLTKLRMERAAALLVGSSASLAEVGGHVGYDSEFAFSRAFRRHYRRPPGLFRREERARTLRTLAMASSLRVGCLAA